MRKDGPARSDQGDGREAFVMHKSSGLIGWTCTICCHRKPGRFIGCSRGAAQQPSQDFCSALKVRYFGSVAVSPGSAVMAVETSARRIPDLSVSGPRSTFCTQVSRRLSKVSCSSDRAPSTSSAANSSHPARSENSRILATVGGEAVFPNPAGMSLWRIR